MDTCLFYNDKMPGCISSRSSNPIPRSCDYSFYMNDRPTGVNDVSLQERFKYKSIVCLCKAASLCIHTLITGKSPWRNSNPELVFKTKSVDFSTSDEVLVLDIIWLPDTDQFKIRVKRPIQRLCTCDTFIMVSCNLILYVQKNYIAICRKFSGNTMKQIMGPLPKSRIALYRPFTIASVDFVGPFFLKPVGHRLKVRFKCCISFFRMSLHQNQFIWKLYQI